MISDKKWFLPVVITTLLFVLNTVLGWWWMNGFIAFGVSYFFMKTKISSFIVFFCVVFVLWFAQSVWKDSQTEYAVSHFLSSLTGDLPPYLTYIITGLTGGLFSGWAGYLGCNLRHLSK